MAIARLLLNTPIRDLLRFRVSGRLDWRKRIAEANLPAPAHDLIRRVVKRTRLWRIEKAGIVDELAAHFLDAQETGQPIESVIEAFGDERRAAKLIRRAKIRNRPILWHAWRWFRQLVGLLIVIYAGVLAPIFFFSHPKPTVDYLAQLNKPCLGVPESDRAWPIYRKAILALSYDAPGKRNPPAWLQYSVDGKHWPEIQTWLRKHSAGLELIRQGGEKRVMGFVFGPDGSCVDAELWPEHRRSDNSGLLYVLLPHLFELNPLAEMLDADVKLALIDKDKERLVRDIDAIAHLAKLTRDNDAFLITGLLSLGIENIGLRALDRALVQNPGLLSNAELIQIAHRLSIPQLASDFISFRGEKMFFYDSIQRSYTDDGNGDGHFTADGARFFFLFEVVSGANSASDVPQVGESAFSLASGPGTLLFLASRKEILAEYDRLMDQYEASLHVPFREADHHIDDKLREEMVGSLRLRFKYALVWSIMPALNMANRTPERYLGHRDGAVAAIALELFRRQNGKYPGRLDELVPTYLPSVPADRITGEPIKYRLDDGHPLLYSVGADRIDDGGTPAIVDGKPQPDRAATWTTSPDRIPKGDWILYPIQSPPEEDK